MPPQNATIKKEMVAWIRKYELLDRQEETAVLGMARKMTQEVFPKKTDELFLIDFFKAWAVIYVLDYFYDTLGVNSIQIRENRGFSFFIPQFAKISLRDKKRINGLSAVVQSIICRYNKKQRTRIRELIEEMLKAMEYENRIHHMRKQPSFFEYLEKTKESIGSKFLFAIAYFHYSLNYSEKLRKLDDSCARIARLTNDLVSFIKEKQEQKKNAVDLLIIKGMSEGVAKKYIKKRIKHEQTNIIKILKKFPEHTILKSFIFNFVKWLLNIYGKGANS